MTSCIALSIPSSCNSWFGVPRLMHYASDTGMIEVINYNYLVLLAVNKRWRWRDGGYTVTFYRRLSTNAYRSLAVWSGEVGWWKDPPTSPLCRSALRKNQVRASFNEFAYCIYLPFWHGWLFFFLLIYFSICQSVPINLSWFFCLSVCPSVHLSVCLPLLLLIHLFMCVTFCTYICPASMHLSVFLVVSLSVNLFLCIQTSEDNPELQPRLGFVWCRKKWHWFLLVSFSSM